MSSPLDNSVFGQLENKFLEELLKDPAWKELIDAVCVVVADYGTNIFESLTINGEQYNYQEEEKYPDGFSLPHSVWDYPVPFQPGSYFNLFKALSLYSGGVIPTYAPGEILYTKYQLFSDADQTRVFRIDTNKFYIPNLNEIPYGSVIRVYNPDAPGYITANRSLLKAGPAVNYDKYINQIPQNCTMSRIAAADIDDFASTQNFLRFDRPKHSGVVSAPTTIPNDLIAPGEQIINRRYNRTEDNDPTPYYDYTIQSFVDHVVTLTEDVPNGYTRIDLLLNPVNTLYALSTEVAPDSIDFSIPSAVGKMKSFFQFIKDSFAYISNVKLNGEANYFTVSVEPNDPMMGDVMICEKVVPPANCLVPVMDKTVEIRENNHVILQAYPFEHFEFDHWSIPGSASQLDFIPSKDTTVDNAITITCYFRVKHYKISVIGQTDASFVAKGVGDYQAFILDEGSYIPNPDTVHLEIKAALGYTALGIEGVYNVDGQDYIDINGDAVRVSFDGTTYELEFVPTDNVTIKFNTRPNTGKLSIQQWASQEYKRDRLAPINGQEPAAVVVPDYYDLPPEYLPKRVDVTNLAYNTGFATGTIFEPLSYVNEKVKFLYWKIQFTHWEDNDGEVISTKKEFMFSDFFTNIPLLFEHDNDTIDIEAYFEANLQDLSSYVPCADLYGTVLHKRKGSDKDPVSGEASYNIGEIIEVSQTVKPGFVFDRWYSYGTPLTNPDGEEINLTSPTLVFVFNKGQYLVALYKPETVAYSFSSSDVGHLSTIVVRPEIVNQCFADNKSVDTEYQEPTLLADTVWKGSQVTFIPESIHSSLDSLAYQFTGGVRTDVDASRVQLTLDNDVVIYATFSNIASHFYQFNVIIDATEQVDYTTALISGTKNDAGEYSYNSVIRLKFSGLGTLPANSLDVNTTPGVDETALYNQNGYLDITITSNTIVMLDLDQSTALVSVNYVVGSNLSDSQPYGPNDFVEIEGAGTYHVGQLVNLKANPRQSVDFVKWYKVEGSTFTIVSTSPLISFRVQSNVTYLVQLSAADVAFSVNYDIERSTVVWTPTLYTSGEHQGEPDYTASDANKGSYPYGTILYLKATSTNARAWEFSRWSAFVDNAQSAETTLTLSHNTEVKCEFISVKYPVSVTISGQNPHGTTPLTSGNYDYGKEIILTANPDEGYESNWLVTVGSDQPVRYHEGDSITIVDNTAITIEFTQIQVTCLVQNGDEYAIFVKIGQIPVTIAADGTFTVPYGSTITVEVTCPDIYNFVQWFDGSTVCTATTSSHNKTYSQNFVITAPVTINAQLQIKQMIVTVLERTGSLSNFTVAGSGTYDYGTSILLTCSPEEGYEFAGWYDAASSGNLLSNNRSYQVTLTDNVTVYVSVVRQQCSLKLADDGLKGHFVYIDTSVKSIDDITTIIYNESVAATHAHAIGSTVDYGTTLYAYALQYPTEYPTGVSSVADRKEWIKEHLESGKAFGDSLPFFCWSDKSVNSPYALAVIENVSLSALFSEEGYNYSSLFFVCDENQVQCSGAGRYIKGSEVKVVIAPKQGFCIKGITVDGTSIAPSGVNLNDNIPETVTITLNIEEETFIEVDTAPAQYEFFIKPYLVAYEHPNSEAIKMGDICKFKCHYECGDDSKEFYMAYDSTSEAYKSYSDNSCTTPLVFDYGTILKIVASAASANGGYAFKSWENSYDNILSIVVTDSLIVPVMYTQSIDKTVVINKNPKLGTIFNAGTSSLAPVLVEAPYAVDYNYPRTHKPVGPSGYDASGTAGTETDLQNVRLRSEALEYGMVGEWALFVDVPLDIIMNSANTTQMFSGMDRQDGLLDTLKALDKYKCDIFAKTNWDVLRQMGLVVLFYVVNGSTTTVYGIDYIAQKYNSDGSTWTNFPQTGEALKGYFYGTNKPASSESLCYSEFKFYSGRSAVVVSDFANRTAYYRVKYLDNSDSSKVRAYPIPNAPGSNINYTGVLGEFLELKATMINDYYYFDAWVDGNTTPNVLSQDPTYKVQLLNTNTSVPVTSIYRPRTKPKVFDYTVQIEGEGTVTAPNYSNGVLSVEYGSQVTFTFAPAANNKIHSIQYTGIQYPTTDTATITVTNPNIPIIIKFIRITYKSYRRVVGTTEGVLGVDVSNDMIASTVSLFSPVAQTFVSDSLVTFSFDFAQFTATYSGYKVASMSVILEDTSDRSMTVYELTSDAPSFSVRLNGMEGALDATISSIISPQYILQLRTVDDSRNPIIDAKNEFSFTKLNVEQSKDIVNNKYYFNNVSSSTGTLSYRYTGGINDGDTHSGVFMLDVPHLFRESIDVSGQSNVSFNGQLFNGATQLVKLFYIPSSTSDPNIVKPVTLNTIITDEYNNTFSVFGYIQHMITCDSNFNSRVSPIIDGAFSRAAQNTVLTVCGTDIVDSIRYVKDNVNAPGLALLTFTNSNFLFYTPYLFNLLISSFNESFSHPIFTTNERCTEVILDNLDRYTDVRTFFIKYARMIRFSRCFFDMEYKAINFTSLSFEASYTKSNVSVKSAEHFVAKQSVIKFLQFALPNPSCIIYIVLPPLKADCTYSESNS